MKRTRLNCSQSDPVIHERWHIWTELTFRMNLHFMGTIIQTLNLVRNTQNTKRKWICGCWET